MRRQLAPGAYVTTKKANVRRDDAKHTAFAELAKGAAVTVIANGGRTSNFRAGLKKNEHSWADRGVEENGWLEDGKLRAAPAASAVDAEPSPASDRLLAPPAPVRSNRGERRRIPTTAPIAIPSSRRGGGSPPREQRAASATPPAFFQTAARREPPPALARSLKVFVHMTSGNYRDDIEREGLVAGKGRGIGLPDEAGKQGPVDPHHLYVLSGSNAETSRFVSMESGRQPIVIVSRTEASDRDVNYPKGGAYRFDREIAPLAGRPEADGPGTVSFPLPITGSSRQVLAQFLNEMLSPDDQVDADAATEIVETMKKLVEFVLEGRNSGLGRKMSVEERASMEMEIPGSALQQLALWQLVLGYRLREEEAKGDYMNHLN